MMCDKTSFNHDKKGLTGQKMNITQLTKLKLELITYLSEIDVQDENLPTHDELLVRCEEAIEELETEITQLEEEMYLGEMF